MSNRIYFYPHAYMRERQLDVIRAWPKEQALNSEIAERRRGDQVPKTAALQAKKKRSWKQRVPLLNVKQRPQGIPSDAIVYVWGGLIATGSFIVELDNPYSLVGYNLRAMPIWRGIIKHVLLSRRCREIRCMSEACRRTARQLFGDEVYRKAEVWYPSVGIASGAPAPRYSGDACRFVFVATQFRLKGGDALIKAFQRVVEQYPAAQLDMYTYVPRDVMAAAESVPNLNIYEPTMTRHELMATVYPFADALVHPTYVDSFGLVVLEALACGLPVIGTNVYAIGEMVRDGQNGFLLDPPVSVWDGVTPSKYFYSIENIQDQILATDVADFEEKLASAMMAMAADAEKRRAMADCSKRIFDDELKVEDPVAG